MKELGVDWATKIANGNLSESKVIHKFGSNPDVGVTMEDIWSTGGVYTWLQTAVQLEAISTSTDDTLTGSGAQKLVVEGLDANFNEVSSTINMNGTSASTATTQTFKRVHRAYVSQTGTYQSTTLTASQAGTITIRTSSAGATHITLGSSGGTYMGQSEVARYTIPAGYTAFLHNIIISGDSLKAVNAYLFRRTNANQTSSGLTTKRLMWRAIGIKGIAMYEPEIPVKIEQMTDIWLTANVESTSATVEGSFEIVIIKSEVADQW